jgi:hypothetical protein
MDRDIAEQFRRVSEATKAWSDWLEELRQLRQQRGSSEPELLQRQTGQAQSKFQALMREGMALFEAAKVPQKQP